MIDDELNAQEAQLFYDFIVNSLKEGSKAMLVRIEGDELIVEEVQNYDMFKK